MIRSTRNCNGGTLKLRRLLNIEAFYCAPRRVLVD